MLRIEGLTSGYSAIPVLNGVSIKVEEGQFVAIVGPNGAGKTTLFKTISGIVRPRAGAITFEDHDLLSIRPSQRAHLGIAHVPEGRQVFPSLTVMENLEMGAMTEAASATGNRTSSASSNGCRSSPSDAVSSLARCRADSSRCWRSAAGSPRHPNC
jgi:ABC-type branched-subunit amino acid transport system ATPase component